jgi:glycolate oxidase FAD binding subunit
VAEGRTPEAAVFPGTVDEVRGVVAMAAADGWPIVPWGGGTAAAVGTPPPAGRPALVLGLRRLARLLEHEPGDLTATVEAGMTMEALQGALRARGQWLSLDPPDAGRATIGGVLAANAAGPRRHLYGTMRDLVIGVALVTADGALVRGGGKVVKNVAGYDVPKLMIGSYGTLAIAVEVTVKLRPVPDAERLVAVVFDRLKDAGAGARAVAASDLIPTAVELLDPDAARTLGLDGVAGGALVIGFDGFADQVDWQCAEVARLMAPAGGHRVQPLPAEAWPRLPGAAAGAFDRPAGVMTLTVLPAAVAETLEQGASLARQRGLPTAWSAHAGIGVVTAALFSAGDREDVAPMAAVLEAWRVLARAGGGFATLAWAPLAVKALVPVWDDAGPAGRLMQRIKAQVDPRNILNPGRFVAGI